MIYNLIYFLLLFLLSPYLLVRFFFDRTYRRLVYYRLESTLFPKVASKKKIWVHAASVGEVSLAIELSNRWKEREYDLVITVNTLTGYEKARQSALECYIAPFDFFFAIKRWSRRQKIVGLILIEGEIWPNMIRVISKKYPVVLLNGRVSHSSRKNPLVHFLYRNVVRKLSAITASDEESYAFYQSLGIGVEIYFSGNLKFAFCVSDRFSPSLELDFFKDKLLFVAGSIQKEEVAIILRAYHLALETYPNLYLALIPRHVEKKDEFLGVLKKEDYQIVQSHPPEKFEKKIFLIPLIGVLQDWYYRASLVFVGGSLTRRGGQNMIEPLSLGKIVAVGNHTYNFEFAMKFFRKIGAVCEISDAEGLSSFLIKNLKEPSLFRRQIIQAQAIIEEQREVWQKYRKILDKSFSKG